MSHFISPYDSAIAALGALAALHLAQLLIADVAAIRKKHIPGTPIQSGHDDFLFRAARAHANTNESIGIAILAAAFTIASGGAPVWVNGAIWCFVASRAVHMFAYYMDVRVLRSAAFGIAVFTLVVLLLVGVLGGSSAPTNSSVTSETAYSMHVGDRGPSQASPA